jgi:hypothetical protein
MRSSVRWKTLQTPLLSEPTPNREQVKITGRRLYLWHAKIYLGMRRHDILTLTPTYTWGMVHLARCPFAAGLGRGRNESQGPSCALL